MSPHSTASDASLLDNLLIDTWWFALSHRLSACAFESLARQRAAEGFNAVQLVVGIPPEVAPGHPDAASDAGVPWDLQGTINDAYVNLARVRIEFLNSVGLRVIVLGGWGMQIEWTGTRFMQKWWQTLIRNLDDLDVIYCVTGEVDLWIDMPDILLPAKSTGDLRGSEPINPHGLRRLLERIAVRLMRLKTRWLQPHAATRRKQAWGKVMLDMRSQTQRPIIVHTGGIPGSFSHQLIDHAELLAAVTVQTGHDESSRAAQWQRPMQLAAEYGPRFINLEPWYEGIRERFFTDDQLFAYWCNMLGGACSFAYGAHGVWNVGDGRFLSHWGKQTLAEARALPTPRLLGKSHHWFCQHGGFDIDGQSTAETTEQQLTRLTRQSRTGTLVFIPDVRLCNALPAGEYFIPGSGEAASTPPASGMLVVWQAKPELT